MNVKNVTFEIVKDYIDNLDVISPKYRARHNHNVLGLGLDSNPYTMNTEDHFAFNWEMHRMQVAELKLMINGE